jgi:hypothetical protein
MDYHKSKSFSRHFMVLEPHLFKKQSLFTHLFYYSQKQFNGIIYLLHVNNSKL